MMIQSYKGVKEWWNSENWGIYIMKITVIKSIAIIIVSIIIATMTGYMAGANNITVSINGTQTITAIRDAIQNAINSAGAGDTVTVTGAADRTSTLSINIPPDVTVKWCAAYSGTSNPLIDLSGKGTFEVADGGLIENTGSGSFTTVRANSADKGSVLIKVTGSNSAIGGKIIAGLGSAIDGAGGSSKVAVSGYGEVYNFATHNLRPAIIMSNQVDTVQDVINVTVSGGSVSSRAKGETAYGYAIQTYGDILIEGGEVYTNSGYGRAINLTGEFSKARITDGIVAAYGGGVAISTATTAGVNVTSTKVFVEGGLVYATTGMAIRTTGSSSTVTVSGGCVFAYGNNITGNNNVIYTQNNAGGFSAAKVIDTGTVIAWNQAAGQPAGHPVYDEFSTQHITKMPVDATAKWAKNPSGNSNDKDGISYMNGKDNGFFELDVTVARHTVSAVIDQIGDYVFPAVAAAYVPYYNYDNLTRDYSSPAKVFTITNTGTDALNLSATLETDAKFKIIQLNPIVISAGESATVEVKPIDGILSDSVPEQYEDTLIITGSGNTGNITPIKIGLSLTINPTHGVAITAYGDYGMIQYDGGQTENSLTVQVIHNGSLTLTMIPYTNYIINYIMVRTPGAGMAENKGPQETYTFTDITGECMLTVYFTQYLPTKYTIVHFAGNGGTIIPHDTQPAPNANYVTGNTPYSNNYEIKANLGYYISDVRVDGKTKLPEGSNMITSMTYEFDQPGYHVITANFEKITYIINTLVEGGGVISPDGDVIVEDGDDVTFTFLADLGYRLVDVKVDGQSISNLNSPYKFSSVHENGSITARFERIKYTVIADATTEGGSIKWDDGIEWVSGIARKDAAQSVQIEDGGDSPVFMIIADEGYHIKDVFIENNSGGKQSVGPRETYTFSEISGNRAIYAEFIENPQEGQGYVITAYANEYGQIAPSGNSYVADGDDKTFIVTADQDFRISKLLVDGVDMLSSMVEDKFTFENVIMNHTIYAEFEHIPHSRLEEEDPVPDPDPDPTPTPIYNPSRNRDPKNDSDTDPDLDPGVIHEGDVSHLLHTKEHMRYIQGVGRGLFKPERPITRAEAAQLFYNLLLDKDIKITARFDDIPSGAWYTDAVLSLASLGLITGYPDGHYRPEVYITRAEFVVLMVKFAIGEFDDDEESPFMDVPETHWAHSQIHAASQYSWVKGYDNGKFAPGDYLLRSEAIAILNRVLKRVPDKLYIDSHPELFRFDDVLKDYWQYYGIMEAYHEHDYERIDGSEKWIDS